MPSISLCIPVFRSAAFLPGLFDRLDALDPEPAEILLLDDASPDQSADLLNAFAKRAPPRLNLRLLRNDRNMGIAAAYNRLALEAHGEWVHILDADDYPVEPDFYARLSGELRPGRDLVVAAIASDSRIVQLGASAFGWLVPREPPRWWPLLGSFATRAGVIYRRGRLLNQPFAAPAFPGSDVLHFLQMRDGCNCAFVSHAHVFYRVHGAAASSASRNYCQYRTGLARFDRLTRLTHSIDLGARMLGQRAARHRRKT